MEDVLHKHTKIKQAQVIGVPDPRLMEVPAAYVILKEGEHATPAEIVAWSKMRMANFRVPRYVKIVDSFENIGMTGNAKVQKNKLRAQALIDFGLEGRKAKSISRRERTKLHHEGHEGHEGEPKTFSSQQTPARVDSFCGCFPAFLLSRFGLSY